MPPDLTKYINTSRSLKIWTIITHCLIFCGGGHGVFPIVFIEFFGLDTGKYFSPVAYFMLLGQILLIVSILLKELPAKIITHIVGLLLLWAAIIHFIWCALLHPPGYMLFIFPLIPFVICTIITLAGKSVKRLYIRFLTS